MDQMSEIIQLENQYSSGVYAKREVAISHGKGALLYDLNGQEYIDCMGGQGAANLGHAHPAILKAITDQVAEMISCPESLPTPKRAIYQQMLCERLFMKSVFLCNSGTEAVEGAIKFARYSTGRREIIAAMRGFHGRTMGSLSATWNKSYREPFQPLVPDYTHIPYNNYERLEKAISPNTAAVLLEVVQGEGGVYPGDTEFFQAAQRLCRANGALLIIDEVQTGFGRTGKLFAHQHHNLQPDIVTLGKSIAGGVPMGAVVMGERVENITYGIHGSTFGGNPLACAAAIAALETYENDHLPENAAELGSWMLEELRKFDSPVIREVRGLGLMIGIELKSKSAPYIAALGEAGVIALPAGMSVIRLLPPLVINGAQLETVLGALQDVLSE